MLVRGCCTLTAVSYGGLADRVCRRSTEGLHVWTLGTGTCMHCLRVPYFLECGAVLSALYLLVTASISTKVHAKHVSSSGDDFPEALHVAWLCTARFLQYTGMLWTDMIPIKGFPERELHVASLLVLNRMAVPCQGSSWAGPECGCDWPLTSLSIILN
jgi:hypothetical protein